VTLAVKDATGASINLATGSGDGSGTPFLSPVAVAAGAPADAAASSLPASWSMISLLKGIWALLSGTLAVSLGSDVVATLTTGRKSAIGATALQMTTVSNPATKGVSVVASSTNTGIVYVGISTVTANAADATDGYPLTAGSSITLPVSNANLVYVIGSATGQAVFWAAA
jgi:hypothetical protein